MNAKQFSYAIVASFVWLGCTTSSSRQVFLTASSDTQGLEQNSSEHSPQDKLPTQQVKVQETPSTAPRRFICPNGWQEEREMPFYAIKDHAQFLRDLPNLNNQTILLELRVSYSNSIKRDTDPPAAKINQPVIVVPIQDVLEDYNDLEFVLMHQHEILPGKDLDECWVTGVFYERYSESFERTIQDPILRIVALLEVSDTINETSQRILKFIAHPQ